MGCAAFYLADSREKLARVIGDEFFPADGCLEKNKKWLKALRKFLPLLISKL